MKSRTVASLDARCFFAFQKCQQSQGSGGVLVAKRRTVVTSGRVASSRFKSVNSLRDRGVLVAKRRTVVTFGRTLRLRVSKVSTVSGIGGGPGRKTQNCHHFWTRCVFTSQKCRQSQGSGGFLVAESRTVVTFWTCLWRGEKREERREEKREERAERRGEERRGVERRREAGREEERGRR